MTINSSRAHLSTGKLSWLQRLGAVVVLVLAVIAGLALSAFLFGFLLVLAAAGSLWLGWQRWRLKRRRAGSSQSHSTAVIQGEYEVIHEETIEQRQHRRDPNSSKKQRSDRI